jgi:hypothetical protein
VPRPPPQSSKGSARCATAWRARRLARCAHEWACKSVKTRALEYLKGEMITFTYTRVDSVGTLFAQWKNILYEAVGSPFGLPPHPRLAMGIFTCTALETTLWPHDPPCIKHPTYWEVLLHLFLPGFHTRSHSSKLTSLALHNPLPANPSVNTCQKRMSRQRVRDVISKLARHGHHTRKSEGTLRQVRNLAEEKMFDVSYNDLTIQFIGASGLPKMDVVGSADPYFVADLDSQISIV